MTEHGGGDGALTAADLFCVSCDAPLGASAKFCSQCGAPVARAAQSAESHKQVTVLFADVVHSMDIAAAVGAERLREIMTELVAASAAVVQRYGGRVDKFTGDGIHGGLRRTPRVWRTTPFRACLSALGIQEEAKRLAVDVLDVRDGVGVVAAGWPELGPK